MLTLVLVRSFNLPNVCEKYYTEERKRCKRFLECMEDKFLTAGESQLGMAPHWIFCLLTEKDLWVM